MVEHTKHSKASLIPILTAILLLFMFPILLLSKVMTPIPNAEFAHKLLYYSGGVTIITFFIQWIFIKITINKAKSIVDNQGKRVYIYRIFSHRLWLTFVAIIPNFIFLSLTNFDMFLVLNVVLVLWMLNIFPFNVKIDAILKWKTQVNP